jgi:oligopeptide transport system permease protein
MIKFIARRLLEFIPVFFVIVTVVFFLVRGAPGGPFDSNERDLPPEVLQKLEEAYNLDAPLHEQYVDYMKGLAQGDLGPSMKKPTRTVTEWIALRFPVSLELGIYAIIIAIVIGLAAGIIASIKPNSSGDYISMSMATMGICIPNFVLGPVLVYIFALKLEWLPVSGWYSPMHKVLPAITLGTIYAAYIARLTRGGMIEVLAQDFIRTARAKGLSEARIVLKHALRGGVQPVVAFLGPAIARMLTGSFVVETIFQVPGLGQEFVKSAFNRDYTMLMGVVLFYAGLILIFNLLVDIVQAWLDPRVRYGR